MRLDGYEPKIEDVQALVDWWTPILGLSHWRIAVELKDGMDVRAESEVDGDYPGACLRFRTEYKDGGFRGQLDDFEELIVHEMLHIADTERRRMVWDAKRDLPKPLRRSFWAAYERLNERFIETLCRSLVAAKRSTTEPICIGSLPPERSEAA